MNRIGSRRRSAAFNTVSEFVRLEPRYLLTAGIGLQAQYFNNPNLDSVALTRVDSNIDFDWGAGSPDAAITADQFSVRWTGTLEARHTETYTFFVQADDGARLRINGQTLVDQFDANGVADASGTIDLIVGRTYDLQLEYREASGNASVKLEWTSASQTREPVPSTHLYAADRGSLLEEVWQGIDGDQVDDLTSDGNFPTQPDTVVSLSQFETSSDAGDNFGRRVRGLLHAPATGPYRFFLAADQSAELWLSNTKDPAQKQRIATVDSPTAVQGWLESSTQASSEIYLVAGQAYYVEALQKESAGTDHLAVGWLQPESLDIEVIPGEHLSPVSPEVKIFADRQRFSEASTVPGRFTIVRSGAPNNNALTVNYTVSGQAINGTDYQNLPGTITIPAGANSIDLEVSPLTDTQAEGDETFIVQLTDGLGYQVGYKSERTVHGILHDDAPAPAGGTSLWNGSELADFSHFGGTFTTETDGTYGDVIQAVIDGNQDNPWNAQLKQNIDGPVNVGDILYVEFRVKSVGGNGTVSAIFERSGSPFTKSLAQGISVTPNWERVQIPFHAAESYAASEASFGFHLGYGAQTIQFTDFQLLNYGPPKTVAPKNDFFLNNINGTWGVSQTVSVTGQPFTTAYEVETQTVPPQNWNLQSVSRNEGVVGDGDVMRFEFYIRAAAGTNPVTNFLVQETTNYSSLHNQTINLTSDWQFFSIDVTSDADYGPQGLQAIFTLGHELQTVQTGDFHWTNLSNQIDIEDLPSQIAGAGADYQGRLGTDSWREVAAQDIDANRKSNLTIHVNDVHGNPLEGALVSLRQTKHEFLFGSAINAYQNKLGIDANEEGLKYQAEIKRLFNAVVLENSLKWPGFLQDRQRGIDGAAFATNNDLYLRGHNIIWPSRSFMPDSVWSEYDTRVVDDGQASADAWLKATIEARFDDALTTFDGIIPEWDVVNEPWSNRDVMDILGDSIVVDWYQRVRDFDPDIQLALNDFQIFSHNGNNVDHRANFEYWLGLLNDAGLLDVIGEQSHYNDASLTDMNILSQLIDTYHTQFNQPIAITEFDVDSIDEQNQADYLRDYMTMTFSKSAVTQFLHWGFWEGSHWIPNAALYRRDFSIKPNGQAYEDLVFGRWWSDTQGTTRAGTLSANVFRGDYDVRVEYAGQSYLATVTVDATGNSSLTIDVSTDPNNADPLLDVDQPEIIGGVAREITNSGRWREPDGESVTFVATLGEVTQQSDGTWNWSFTPTQVYTDQQVTVTITDSRNRSRDVTFEFDAVTNVFQRGVSYGNASGFADNEVDSSIEPLIPGQTATESHYSNFVFGLNRVVVEIAGLGSNTLTNDDFEFRVGNTDDPSNWMELDLSSSIPLPSISVTTASTPGVDQVLLSWPNNAIQNQWLQLVIKANARTGLAFPDRFYFGNQIGDVNGDVNAQDQVRVNAFDTLLVRANHTPSVVDIANRYDVDKSARVNAFDTLRVRANHTTGGLLLFTAPLPPPMLNLTPQGDDDTDPTLPNMPAIGFSMSGPGTDLFDQSFGTTILYDRIGTEAGASSSGWVSYATPSAESYGVSQQPTMNNEASTYPSREAFAAGLELPEITNRPSQTSHRQLLAKRTHQLDSFFEQSIESDLGVEIVSD